MEKIKYGWKRYALLGGVLSFLGWAMETLYILIAHGRLVDRGFMRLPLCPIYGASILLTYYLIGTPESGGALLGRVKGRARKAWYLLGCFLLPNTVEFLTGLFFDRVMHTPLWDYSYQKYHLYGYVSLRNAVIWTALLYAFMRYGFTRLRSAIGRLPVWTVNVLAWTLLLAILIDSSLQFARAWIG